MTTKRRPDPAKAALRWLKDFVRDLESELLPAEGMAVALEVLARKIRREVADRVNSYAVAARAAEQAIASLRARRRARRR